MDGGKTNATSAVALGASGVSAKSPNSSPAILEATGEKVQPLADAPIVYTKFRNLAAAAKQEIHCAWGELVAMLRRPVTYPKPEQCPLLVLAAFGEQRSDK